MMFLRINFIEWLKYYFETILTNVINFFYNRQKKSLIQV